MLDIVTLPPGFIGTTTAYIGELFTDLWYLVAIAIGLPLGFWVIRKAISIIRPR